ncbi:MAG: SDR family NAD(P)-dependent oxidoreductase [Planctomycetes bacterium]|nr:SDR family NAD(P)-dependent oxidoreductase [Planctomycetota bacterium]
MRRADLGHVIHVSSMSGHRVPAGSGVYSATKYAVRSLTEGLRQELRELKSSIRVSSISPGFVETEFAGVYNRDPAAIQETYGRFKVLEANDVADALVYLLGAPAHVSIHDVLMRPTDQPS